MRHGHRRIHGASWAPVHRRCSGNAQWKVRSHLLSSWDGVRYYQAPGLTVQPVRLSSRSTFVCAPGHKASPSMANKTQQVSAPGARRLTWCGSRVTGPDGCDGRNGRRRPHRAAWESSRSGHLIYLGPGGKRKEEREPRVKKKRKSDVGSAHASTLRPAPQFPSLCLCMLVGVAECPPRTLQALGTRRSLFS